MVKEKQDPTLRIGFALWPFTAELEIPIPVAAVVYLATVSLTVFVGIGMFAWPFLLAAFWERISELAQSPLIRAILTAAFALIGLLLYLSRKYLRSVYGAAEVVVGAASCWNGLGTTSSNSLAAMLSVAGGLYIIVRGMDNFETGRTNPKTAPNPGHNQGA
jgi:hypothetical protein